MLIIRQAQWQVFEQAAVARFERHLLARARVELPDDHAEHGDDGLLPIIRDAIADAGRHDLVSEAGVWAYLWLSLLYGRQFAVDPALPWATEILADTRSRDEPGRVAALLAATSDDLAARAAAGHEFIE